jgi:hypothetical protein
MTVPECPKATAAETSDTNKGIATYQNSVYSDCATSSIQVESLQPKGEKIAHDDDK